MRSPLSPPDLSVVLHILSPQAPPYHQLGTTGMTLYVSLGFYSSHYLIENMHRCL